MTGPQKALNELQIERVPIGQLRIFEISEAELASLERGSAESVYLNLACAALPTDVGLTTSLATRNFPNNRTFQVFVILAVVGYLAGITFLLRWLVSRKSLKKVSTEIRKWIPSEEGGQATEVI